MEEQRGERGGKGGRQNGIAARFVTVPMVGPQIDNVPREHGYRRRFEGCFQGAGVLRANLFSFGTGRKPECRI